MSALRALARLRELLARPKPPVPVERVSRTVWDALVHVVHMRGTREVEPSPWIEANGILANEELPTVLWQMDSAGNMVVISKPEENGNA